MIPKLLFLFTALIFFTAGCSSISDSNDSDDGSNVILNKIFISSTILSGPLYNGYAFASLNPDGTELELFGGEYSPHGVFFSLDKSHFYFPNIDEYGQNADQSEGLKFYVCSFNDKQIDSLGIYGNSLRLSNDNKQIAILANDEEEPIKVANIDGSGFRSLTNFTGDRPQGLYGWGEDDKTIIYYGIYDDPENRPFYEISVEGDTPPEAITSPVTPTIEAKYVLSDFTRADVPFPEDTLTVRYVEGHLPGYYFQIYIERTGSIPFYRFQQSIYTFDLNNKKEYLIADSLSTNTRLSISPDTKQLIFTSDNGLEISDINGDNRRVILGIEYLSSSILNGGVIDIRWL